MAEFVWALYEIWLIGVDGKLDFAKIFFSKFDVNEYIVGILLESIFYAHYL